MGFNDNININNININNVPKYSFKYYDGTTIKNTEIIKKRDK